MPALMRVTIKNKTNEEKAIADVGLFKVGTNEYLLTAKQIEAVRNNAELQVLRNNIKDKLK